MHVEDESQRDETAFSFDEFDFGPTGEELQAAFKPKGVRRVTPADSAPAEASDARRQRTEKHTVFLESPDSAPRQDRGGETHAFSTTELSFDDVEASLQPASGAKAKREPPTTDESTGVGSPVDESHGQTGAIDSADSEGKAAPHASRKPLIITVAAIALIAIAIAAWFVLQPHRVSYNVVCLDSVTHESIADTKAESGEEGSRVDVRAPEVEGYALTAGEPSERSIELAAGEGIVVTFTYDKIASCTVECVDQDGTGISEPRTLDGLKAGETIAETAPEVEGYVLTSLDRVELVVSGDEPNVITFTYARLVSFVTRCVSASGEELRADAGTGGVGQDVVCEAPAIDGYTLVSEPSQIVKLSPEEGANVVTFTYEKVVAPASTTYSQPYYYDTSSASGTTQTAPAPDPGTAADVYLN